MNFKITLISTILLTFFIPVNTYAQELPRDPQTGKVVFTDVVEFEGENQEELFSKAKSWIVKTLKSGDNMVELSGNNTDEIVGTGNLDFSSEDIMLSYKEVLNFKFIVKCKDGRIKYSIENLQLFYTYNTNTSTRLENIQPLYPVKDGKEKKKLDQQREIEINTAVLKNINALIEDFIRYMNTEESDW